jgi:hypothetical protein
MLETLHQLAAGHSIDPAAYESALTRHVAEFVKRQVEAGIDTVSDGECSKPSFQHYVAERLAGFDPRMPEGGLPVPTGPMGLDGRDALMFPDFYRNVLEHNPFRNTVRMAPRVCVGPIRYVGHDKLRRDIENLKTAMVAAGADEGFMPASAPITALQNDYSQRKRNLSRLTVTPCERIPGNPGRGPHLADRFPDAGKPMGHREPNDEPRGLPEMGGRPDRLSQSRAARAT